MGKRLWVENTCMWWKMGDHLFDNQWEVVDGKKMVEVDGWKFANGWTILKGERWVEDG